MFFYHNRKRIAEKLPERSSAIKGDPDRKDHRTNFRICELKNILYPENCQNPLRYVYKYPPKKYTRNYYERHNAPSNNPKIISLSSLMTFSVESDAKK